MAEMKSPGKILNESLDIYVKNFKNLVLITLLLCLPILLLYYFAPYSVFNFKFTEHIGYFLLTWIVGVLIGSLLSLYVTYIAYKSTKKKSNFKEALNYAISNYWNGLGTNVLKSIMLIGLLILLIVPGVIFCIYWAFVFPVFVIKNLRGKQALDYSKSLVKGRWWDTFGYLFCIGFVSVLPVVILSIIFSHFFPSNLGYCIYYALSLIFALFSSVSMVVLFLELDRTKVVASSKPKKSSKK